jgi:hypothetical protein
MALGSSQPLTEMSTRNLPGSKGRPARRADKLTAISEPDCLDKMWEPRRLTTLWVFTACYRDLYLKCFGLIGHHEVCKEPSSFIMCIVVVIVVFSFCVGCSLCVYFCVLCFV